MGEVVILPGWTKLPLPKERVLNAAGEALEDVFVLGWDKNRKLYAATSNPDLMECVMLAQKFIHKAMNGDYDG